MLTRSAGARFFLRRRAAPHRWQPRAGHDLGVDLGALGIDPALLDARSDQIDVGDNDEHDDDNNDAPDDAALRAAVDAVPRANIPREVDDLLSHDVDSVQVHVSEHELNDPAMLAELMAMTGMSLEEAEAALEHDAEPAEEATSTEIADTSTAIPAARAQEPAAPKAAPPTVTVPEASQVAPPSSAASNSAAIIGRLSADALAPSQM